MKRYVGFGSELTLLELIIAIGLFSIFAAICLRFFAASHQILKQSEMLSHAIIAAENAAECFKAGTEPEKYYSSEWEPTEKRSAYYCLKIDDLSQSTVKTENIRVTDKDGSEIFSLTVDALSEVKQ